MAVHAENVHVFYVDPWRVFSTTVISDLLASTAMQSCHIVARFAQRCVFTTGFPDSSRCEHDCSPQPSTPSSDTIWSSTAFAAPQSANNQSAMIGLSDRLSSLRRNTAVRLNFQVARQFAHHPESSNTQLVSPKGRCSFFFTFFSTYLPRSCC